MSPRRTFRRCAWFVAGWLALALGASAADVATWSDADESAIRAANEVHGGVVSRIDLPTPALVLDGFSGWLRRPAPARPANVEAFTVSGWFAPAAYPWHAAPLLDAGDFALELEARGAVRFRLRAGGQGWTLTGPVLAPRSWHHVAAGWRPGEGASLYVDGILVVQQVVAGSFEPDPAADWLVGRSREVRRPEGSLRPEATAPVYSFIDGVIAGLKVSDRAPDAAEIRRAAADPAWRGVAPLPRRVLPAGPAAPGPFGAYATTLSFYPEWDRAWRNGPAADVVVRFDRMPGRFIFWRGTSYIPHWVTENGVWYTNEFNETWGDMRGSGEPMSDKQCRYSRVAILESGEARAVVHWRYALTDVFYQIARADPATGWGDWSDEVYTIYPDGTAVRDVTLHTSAPAAPHEWHEAIVVMGPGMTPEQSLEPAALTVVGSNGRPVTFSWDRETPPWTPAEPADCCIQLVNTRSRLRPFAMVRPQDRGTFNLFAKEVRRDVSMFPWWNHWPAAPNPSDGRYALAADRPSHASLANIAWEPLATGPGWIRKVMLTGLTERPAEDLRPMLAAWATPPIVTATPRGSVDYVVAEKAWHVTAFAPGQPVVLHVAASTAAPLAGAAFVVRAWGDGPVRVSRNGRDLVRGTDYRVQWRRGLDGTDLVLWLPIEASTPVQLELDPAPEPR
jgi:hypothetical protein